MTTFVDGVTVTRRRTATMQPDRVHHCLKTSTLTWAAAQTCSDNFSETSLSQRTQSERVFCI